jgi:hypothetical protein
LAALLFPAIPESSAGTENGKVNGWNRMEAEFWSRERELNPRPADFSADIMLLDSRALFLTIPYGFAWYLASFVQKLFTTSECFES